MTKMTTSTKTISSVQTEPDPLPMSMDTATQTVSALKSGSNLEKVLAGGHFAVTGELGPPKHMDTTVVDRKIDLLKGAVDAANVTDNQTGIVRLSSIATGIYMAQHGLEPVIRPKVSSVHSLYR